MSVGIIYTPLSWAKWLIISSGAYDAWSNGGKILEPAFGGGSFIEAFLSVARDRGKSISKTDLARIVGVEMEQGRAPHLRQKLVDSYGYDANAIQLLTANYLNETLTDKDFDFVVGNPPWVNFADLPEDYKENVRPLFVQYGIVKNRRNVLLGSSRADLASLFITKALADHLKEGGRAAFFLPSSIFFNDGAHNSIWPVVGSKSALSILRLWDFPFGGVFEGVATRHCAALIESNGVQVREVPLEKYIGDEWKASVATPFDGRSGPWLERRDTDTADFDPITVAEGQKPRQGVNTCGANDIYLLTDVAFEGGVASGLNGLGQSVSVEEAIVYPLAGRRFDEPPTRHIIIPHDNRSGKPFSEVDLRHYRLAHDYFRKHEMALRQRKGQMIQAYSKKGSWWSLLGVGPYSFATWKVMWNALGAKTFEPVVVPGHVQGNQALHAFIPCENIDDAKRIAYGLKSVEIAASLKSFGAEGTCNFAQPGRIVRYLRMNSLSADLFH